jgi:hypothetical protein
MGSFDQLKAKLDAVHVWPSSYLFKFVVPHEQKGALLTLMPIGLIQERWSKNGRYVSVSLTTLMQSSDEVVAVYQRASAITGIIAL